MREASGRRPIFFGQRRRCPECAEPIRREASRCRYCGAELEPFRLTANDSRRLPTGMLQFSGLALGVVLVLALIGVWVYVRSAAAKEYASGSRAERADRCTTALAHYERVLHRYRLAFSGVIGEAARGRRECRRVIAADALRDRGQRARALRGYEQFLASFPASVLREAVELRAAQLLIKQGREQARSGQLAAAFRSYDRILSDYRATDIAADAQAALSMSYASVRQSRRPCRGVHQLDSIANGNWRALSVQAIANRASETDLPKLLYRCGVEAERSRHFSLAKGSLRRLLRDFRYSPLRARARSALIVAEVGAAIVKKRGRNDLPTPPTVGSTGYRSVEVIVTNSSPKDFELLFSDGRVGRSLRLHSLTLGQGIPVMKDLQMHGFCPNETHAPLTPLDALVVRWWCVEFGCAGAAGERLRDPE